MKLFQVTHGITHLESMIYLWKNKSLDLRKQKLKLSQSLILSKNADTFLKISFFFRCYSHFFAIANQLPGFSISRLANVEDFFNVNIFFKCKLNINVSITDHSLYLCSMLLKTSLLLPDLFYHVDFELTRLIEFQSKANIEIIGF